MIISITNFFMTQRARDAHELHTRYLIGVSFLQENNGSNETEIVAWFNNNGYHTAPVTLNLAYNVVLKNLCPKCSITVSNKPLPYSVQSKVRLYESLNF